MELNDLSSMHDLNSFEEAIITKKAAKKNELQKLKKKLRWNKAALQEEIKKLANKDGGYKCILCNIGFNKTEAEKHLKQDAHWKKKFNECVKTYDKIKPTLYVSTAKKKPLLTAAEDIAVYKAHTEPMNCDLNPGETARPEAQSEPLNYDTAVFDALSEHMNHTVYNSWLEIARDDGVKETVVHKTGNEEIVGILQSNVDVYSVPIDKTDDVAERQEVDGRILHDAQDKALDDAVEHEVVVGNTCQTQHKEVNEADLVPPEIFVSTNEKLNKLGFFLGKVMLCKKVEKCLNGDAQTVFSCKFTPEEKSILQDVNKANDVCNNAQFLDKEMKSSRIHFTEWNCETCNHSAKRVGMECHLKSDEHWTNEVILVTEDPKKPFPLSSQPETIGDAIGIISLIVNDKICIVTFQKKDIRCTAVMDLTGVEVSRSSKRRVKSMLELKVGYPVRMNICHVWSAGNESWYYVSSGYVGDDADWTDPLPKPVTLMSIKYDEDQGKAYEKTFAYLNAMEEHIKPKLRAEVPEILLNQLATVTKIHEDIVIAEVITRSHKFGCLIRIQDMDLKGKSFDLLVGAKLKISAILVDPLASVPFMCYDFKAIHSNKPMWKMLRIDLKETKIQAYYDALEILQVNIL